MNVFFAVLALLNWYYIPFESPSAPVEVERVDLNLKQDEMAFSFLSLSEGEAALIQHGNGENFLVNTGGMNTFHELEHLLSLYRVEAISTAIITSRDGLNNLEQAIRKYKIRKVIAGRSAQSVINAGLLQDHNVKLEYWEQGRMEEIMPALSAEMVYDGAREQEGSDISFHFFRHQLFYMSSASQKAEESFLAQPLKNVSIVKLPQYGTKDSFSDLLIEHLDPQIAILFHSENYSPDPDLVERLLEAWIDVYFTKQQGTVTIKLTETNYDVITIMNEG